MKLYRIEKTDKWTLGVLVPTGTEERPFMTLEPPWRENKANVSCVPDGDYKLSVIESPKFGLTALLNEVPGRQEIIFHEGNSVDDTRGCILLGTTFSHINGAPFLTLSRRAFSFFKEVLKSHRESLSLQIISVNEQNYTSRQGSHPLRRPQEGDGDGATEE